MIAYHRARRRAFELVGNARYSRPALHELDDKLRPYLDRDGGFFIEAGANDGYRQSNTYYLERMRGWRGLLVEAIPALYQHCCRERTRSRVVQCALVDQTYEQATIKMHFANLMSVAEGSLQSADELAQHLSSGLEVQGLAESYEVEVPARTLESILDELQPPSEIDFFSLDVEGCESAVLRGLNLDRYAPRYLLVEARYLEQVNDVLQDRYRLIEQFTYHDYFYERR